MLRGVSLGLCAALCACASGEVARRRNSGDAGEVGRALALAAPPAGGAVNVSGRPFAFLVVDNAGTTQLVAYDIARAQVAWKQPADVATRVQVGRNVVVHAERDGGVTGRDFSTGAVVWHLAGARGATLVGHAVDGDDVYVVWKFARATARDHGAELVGIEGRRGAVRFRAPLPANVGAPAARGGIVAVPNQSQFVTLFDGTRGTYLAEILAREEAAAFVEALPEGLFFGSRGLFVASAETALGARKSGGYLEAKLPEFVRVVWHTDGYRPEQNAYSAIDRNRLLWRASTGGARAAFRDGLVVVQNFRFFFAMEAATGKLAWAYAHPRIDVTASAHAGTSILFATAEGEVGALDARTGRRLFLSRAVSTEGAVVIRGGTFDADGFATAGVGGDPSPAALHEVLTTIVLDPDKRFSDVKVFAIEELSALKDKAVTADLLKILERSDSPFLPQRATDALVARQDPQATELYIASVKAHPDYAESRKLPRLDVLARALTGLKARGAVPDLVEHLRLPDTDPVAVRDIADAVLATGAREAVEPFRDYLCQYRSDPAYVNEPGPLIAASEVLLKLGGPMDRELLLFIAEEGKTVSALRTSIRRGLSQTAGGPEIAPSAE